MKISNLRLGNVVSHTKCNKIITVSEIKQFSTRGTFIKDDEIKTASFLSKDIEGIYITNEYLISVGFESSISFYKREKDKSLEIAYNNDTSEIQFYAYFRNNNKDRLDDYVCLRNDLKFIHELQNLYNSITGLELTALIPVS